ncbi:MAG: allantoinase [Frankiales bacterium]|nr:allantoinase [Frankiales bacterium]
MSGCDTVFAARRVALRGGVRPACVAVTDGRVVAVTSFYDQPTARRTVRLGDDEVLIPGLVDSHVHLQNPGHGDWEDLLSATAEAVHAGVTTLVDMPVDSEPVTVDLASLAAKRSAMERSVFTDVGLWGGVVPHNLGTLGALVDAGVLGFKAFMVSPGLEAFPPVDAAQLRTALAELVPYGVPLLVHAETAVGDSGSVDYQSFLASRPPVTEVCAVSAVVEAVAQTLGWAHIVHVSAASSLDVLAAAQARGLRLTAETCPHYLTSAVAKTAPPVRGAADADGLWAGLADGVLGLIVSDHSPCSPPEPVTSFADAAPGVAAAHLRLPVTWTALRKRGYTLTDLVRWCCSGPADLAGLSGKGRIAVGADADLVVFAPDAEVTVEPGRRRSPYDGHHLTGIARRTWLGGLEVDDVPRGRLLRRGGG